MGDSFLPRWGSRHNDLISLCCLTRASLGKISKHWEVLMRHHKLGWLCCSSKKFFLLSFFLPRSPNHVSILSLPVSLSLFSLADGSRLWKRFQHGLSVWCQRWYRWKVCIKSCRTELRVRLWSTNPKPVASQPREMCPFERGVKGSYMGCATGWLEFIATILDHK